ncbi:MAG TPA: hypothetical protein P5531_11415 [Bacteroidales bacterium]|nr:hypothetical protein [Bacteroidales bacterium]HSA44120.1 hypothetical protein [Bacteroidales bacterium]
MHQHIDRMTRNSLIFIIIIIAQSAVHSQVPSVSWAKRAGGSGNECAYSVYTDNSGKRYICGAYTSPSLSFGALTVYNYGGADLFVAAFDTSGEVLWLFGAGAEGNEEAYSISGDGNGKISICGYFTSASFSMGTYTLANAAATYTDIFTAVFDNQGSVIWASSAGGALNDEAYAVSMNDAGETVITGYFGSNSIQFGSQTYTNASPGYSDFFLVSYDLNGNVQWSSHAGNDYGEAGYGVCYDPQGNILVTGGFGSTTLTFGSNSLVNQGWANLFLVKYTASGAVTWARSAGGSNTDEAYRICTDQNGNIYQAGYFTSASIQFNSTTLQNSTSGTSDVFITKYNSNGIAEWALQAGGTAWDAPYAIRCDNNNKLYVTGSFSSIAMQAGNTTLNNAGNSDVFLLKINTDNFEWARSFGNSGYEEGFGLGLDSGGKLLLCGYFSGDAFSPGTAMLYNPTPGTNELFLTETDAAGTPLGSLRGMGGGPDENLAMLTDGAANIVTAGYFSSPSITFGNISLHNARPGTSDVFLVKYDSLGSVLWADSAGGTGWEAVYDLTHDINGNIYASGAYTSDSLAFGSHVIHNAGASDIFVAGYNPSGTAAWAKCFGSTGDEEAYALCSNPDGDLYISGYFSGPELLLDNFTLTNSNPGSNDIFLAKLNAAGDVIWAVSFGGSGNETVYDCLRSNGNGIIVCGAFTSPTLAFGTYQLSNAGASDAFIASLDENSNVLWAASLGGPGNEEAAAMAAEADGSVITGGYFSSPELITPVQNIQNAGSGTNDAFLLKYSPGGTLTRATGMGSTGNEGINSLVITTGQHLVLTGGFDSPGWTIGNQTLSHQGMGDLFIICLDSLWNLSWVMETGGSGTEIPYDLRTDTHGNLYLAGSFSSPELVSGSQELQNAGSFDALLINVHHGIPLAIPADETQLSMPYPNPCAGTVILPLSAPCRQVSIYRTDGSFYRTLQVLPGTNELRMELPAGTYLIRPDTENHPQVFRLVVVR